MTSRSTIGDAKFFSCMGSSYVSTNQEARICVLCVMSSSAQCALPSAPKITFGCLGEDTNRESRSTIGLLSDPYATGDSHQSWVATNPCFLVVRAEFSLSSERIYLPGFLFGQHDLEDSSGILAPKPCSSCNSEFHFDSVQFGSCWYNKNKPPTCCSFVYLLPLPVDIEATDSMVSAQECSISKSYFLHSR